MTIEPSLADLSRAFEATRAKLTEFDQLAKERMANAKRLREQAQEMEDRAQNDLHAALNEHLAAQQALRARVEAPLSVGSLIAAASPLPAHSPGAESPIHQEAPLFAVDDRGYVIEDGEDYFAQTEQVA